MVASSGVTRDRVLDVATGTGLVVAELVRRYGCSVVGVDQSEEMLGRARRRSSARAAAGRQRRARGGRGRAPAVRRRRVRRAHVRLPAPLRGRSGGHDRASWRGSCGRAARSRRSSSACRPSRAAARALARSTRGAGCPRSGRLVSREWYEVGRFLGAEHPRVLRALPDRAASELWREAGIGSVEARPMSFGGGRGDVGERGPMAQPRARAARVLRAAPGRLA